MSNFFQNAGRKFEKRITKEVGGRNTPGSGNQWYAPRDTEVDNFLIESKLTNQDHYVFVLADWYKLELDAMATGRMPIYVIGFYQGQEYAVLHMRTWTQIVDDPDNYLLTKVLRKGMICTRLQRALLREKIKRVPGSKLTNILVIGLAGEEFVIAPKQVFYQLKDLIDEPSETPDP